MSSWRQRNSRRRSPHSDRPGLAWRETSRRSEAFLCRYRCHSLQLAMLSPILRTPRALQECGHL